MFNLVEIKFEPTRGGSAHTEGACRTDTQHSNKNRFGVLYEEPQKFCEMD